MSSKTEIISPPRAWAEIHLSALKHNLQIAKTKSKKAVMAVVKAGAYGHGLEEIARLFAHEGVAFLGVANVGEARRIRQAGIIDTPIYLLGATWEAEREEIVGEDWVPCLSSLDEAAHFNAIAERYGKTLNAHLAIDTGMGRGGFLPEQVMDAWQVLRQFKHINIEGVGSHLSSADEDEVFTKTQFISFSEIIDHLEQVTSLKWKHISNSAGLLGYDDESTNLVRPGLMLYGVSPLTSGADDLKVVMKLKSRVTLIRKLPPFHGVSYGRDFITQRHTNVATIGIGYGDGYSRYLSGKGAEVYIRGQRFPVIGRITMDQIMIDVTDDSSISVGDEVELFGEFISVSEVAKKANTIAWEVFTGITPRVKRLYV